MLVLTLGTSITSWLCLQQGPVIPAARAASNEV